MRVKDMPRNQQKAVFAKMIDANYMNRLESAEHAHERLDYLRKKHDLAENTEDKIWDVWNDKKLTHTQKMAAVRQIKAKAAAELLEHQKAETQPTLTGQIRKKKWELFQKEKKKIENFPVVETSDVGEDDVKKLQLEADKEVAARELQIKKEIKNYPVGWFAAHREAVHREAVAKELRKQKFERQAAWDAQRRQTKETSAAARQKEFSHKLSSEKEFVNPRWTSQSGKPLSTEERWALQHPSAHKLSSEYTLPAAQKFKQAPSGFWHRKGEMRTLTQSEITKKQRFEHNISQFPEYKELRQRGADHDYAISKTLDRRNIKAPEGKMWFEAEVPPFTLKKKTI